MQRLESFGEVVRRYCHGVEQAFFPYEEDERSALIEQGQFMLQNIKIQIDAFGDRKDLSALLQISELVKKQSRVTLAISQLIKQRSIVAIDRKIRSQTYTR